MVAHMAAQNRTTPDDGAVTWRPYGITRGPDGQLWFTEQQAGKIGRFLVP
jgi:hypothetical protein